MTDKLHILDDLGINIYLNPMIGSASRQPSQSAKPIETLLASVPPAARPGWLRLISDYQDSEEAEGRFATFIGGATASRTRLRLWHRISGRFRWDWDGSQVFVFHDGKFEAELSEAINSALPRSRQAKRKYVFGILDYINFEMVRGEDPFSFLTESHEAGRLRMLRWVRSRVGLTVEIKPHPADRSWPVSRPDGPINSKANAVTAVRNLYDSLRALHLWRKPNPAAVDGYDAMLPYERIKVGYAMYGTDNPHLRYHGAQFRIINRETYAPLPHDPLSAAELMIEAARSANWPASARDLLDIFATEGPRPFDLLEANALCWKHSDFGNKLRLRNKGEGEGKWDAKTVMLRPYIVQSMQARFAALHAADPNSPHSLDGLRGRIAACLPVSPSMDQLRALADKGDDETLAAIPLFPNSRGRPFAYTTWHGHYVSKTMKTVRINTSLGEVSPTTVWLRRGMFTERVDHVFATTPVDRAAEALAVVSKDGGHRSPHSIRRYAHTAFEREEERGHEARATEAARRRAKARQKLAGAVPVATSDPETVAPAPFRRPSRAHP